MVYLVTYDLKKSGQDYTSLYNEIKSFGDYNHALESVWFITSELSADTIRDKLRAKMDSNDLVCVSKVTTTYSGYLNNDTIKWLLARVTS